MYQVTTGGGGYEGSLGKHPLTPNFPPSRILLSCYDYGFNQAIFVPYFFSWEAKKGGLFNCSALNIQTDFWGLLSCFKTYNPYLIFRWPNFMILLIDTTRT